MLGLLWVGTLFVGMLSLAFAAVAAFLGLAEQVPPAAAALIVSGVLLLMAAIAAFAAWRKTATEHAPIERMAAKAATPAGRADLASLALNVGLAAGEAFLGRKGR